jgi:Mn2+/Fe2+ NRAMP family transporter
MVAQSRSAHGLALLAELLGGLLVGLGLLASPAGAPVVGLLLFIVVCTYLGFRFWNSAGEFEFPLSLAGAMVALAVALAAAESPAPWHQVLRQSPAETRPVAGLGLAIIGAALVLGSHRRRPGATDYPSRL